MRRPARRARARRPRPADGLRRWREWLDHQYDPGYYTGGRVPPELLGTRPNPYGYVLVLSGGLLLAFMSYAAIVAATAARGPDWLSLTQSAVAAALGALMLASGLRLLRRDPPHRPERSPRQRPLARGAGDHAYANVPARPARLRTFR